LFGQCEELIELSGDLMKKGGGKKEEENAALAESKWERGHSSTCGECGAAVLCIKLFNNFLQ